MLNEKEIKTVFMRFAKANPAPRCELDFPNPYAFLVAIILSAQSTDKGVNKATPALFKVADTPQKMLKLGEDGLKKYISSIGLYNNKAKSIMAMSKMLIDDYKGEVPMDRDELIKLPGVGRKSANVFLNELLDLPYFAVDTHVFRVSHRLGLSKGKDPLAVEKDLDAKVMDPYRTRAHRWLVLHGRYTCLAKKPKCEECFLSDLCPYLKELPKNK